MNALAAHELFARRKDRSIFPHACHLRGHPECDVWPAAMVGAARLSGMLEEATDDAGLDAAVRQYLSYDEMGAVTDDDLERESLNVIGELLEFGDRMTGGVGAGAAIDGRYS